LIFGAFFLLSKMLAKL